MSIGSEGGRSPLPILVLVVVVAVAVWFLRPVIYTGGTLTGLTPTGAPTAFFRGSVDSAPRSAVLNYARSLDYDSTHGVGDYRRLMLGSCPRCAYGPHVFLRPERGAATLQTDMLAEGRVVARLINHDSTGYAKFNLAPHGSAPSVRLAYRLPTELSIMLRRILTLFRAVTAARLLRAHVGVMGGGQFQPPPDHWLTVDSLAQAVGLTADQRAKVAPHYAELNAVVKQAADRRAAFRASMGASMGQMTPEQREAMRPKMDSMRTQLDGLQQQADTH